MDPITLALMGGTALTSIMGAKEANKVNRMNAEISLMNYYAQERARRNAMVEGRRQQAEGKLGTTDAAGNRQRFVPGVGWVTELSRGQQTLQDMTEQMQLEDMQRQQEVNDRNQERQGREDILADAAEDEFRRARRPDEASLRQLLLARGAETRNRAADRAGEMSARQNVRAGGTNAAALAQSARAASDADSAREAGIEATLAARGIADQEYNADRDRARGLYDYFRRSSTTAPTGVRGVLPSGPSTRGTGSADQTLLQMMMQRAPEMDYQNTNNAWTDAGQGLLNMFQSYRGLKDTNKAADNVSGGWGSWQGIVN